MPFRMLTSVAISTWKRSSSSRSRSALRRQTSARTVCATERTNSGIMRASLCGPGDHELHGADEAAPALELGAERATSGRGEGVVLRAAVVLGDVPVARDPALFLEALEGGVERALAHLERIARELLDSLGDSPAVHRLERERAKDE